MPNMSSCPFHVEYPAKGWKRSVPEGEAQARQQVNAAAVDQQQANTNTTASFGETGADSVIKVGFTSNYRCDQLF
jgi:hypothetical protein